MEENTKKSRKRKWKEVPLDNSAFFSGNMEGFVSLEELHDYTLESVMEDPRVVSISHPSDGKKSKGETPSTVREKKKRKKRKQKKKKEKKASEDSISDESKNNDEPEVDQDIQDKNEEETQGKTDEMSGWTGLGVPTDVLKALHDQGFKQPTSIQSLAIPPAIFHHRDIIGAAETGSGKTLAFGIPIIHHIMAFKERSLASTSRDSEDSETETGNSEEEEDINRNPLLALIMTPTRELALQIKEHLVAAMKYTSLKVATVVGGMAAPKQQRLLKQHPEIVVATPGRLWELISLQEEHVTDLEHLRYLVIDEADRMIEQGHFEELSSVMDLIHQKKSAKVFDSCYPEEDKKIKKKPPAARLQKFIFSATLTLPKSFKRQGREQTVSREELLVSLMDKINMDKKKSKVIDVTTKKGTVHSLTEAKLTCSKEEKDTYLYYFLLKYPGRTLVFTNTIDCVRRLASILRLLELSPLPLHANMQQRQRLKNLDRFKSSENGLLVATDVAARGLDIPGIQHVIHYQVPKDPEIYIHRSGRTARALNEGLSVVLVGPEDLASYRKIMKSLNNDNDLESFPVEVPYLKDVQARMSLARQIDKEENKIKKKKSSNDWFLTSAKAMDIQVDDDLYINVDEPQRKNRILKGMLCGLKWDNITPKKRLEDLGDSRERKLQQKKLDHMKASLSSMIKKPLVPKGFSGKFPTKSGKLIVPGFQDEFSNTKHEAKTAVDEVKKKKKRRR